LSDWIVENNCDDELRVEWTLALAKLLEECPDGHLNPERIEIDEALNLSLNDSSTFLDEYSAPEMLEDDSVRNFSTVVFSYGLIIDLLFRGASYLTDKEWSTEEFLNQVADSSDWFESMEDDPLEEILRVCLASPQNRPQSPDALKKLLVANEEISRYLMQNPNHAWAKNIDEPEEDIFEEPEPAEEEQDSGLAIGIDLGTSNSTVAYYQAGKYQYLELRNKRLIPSAIYFKEADQSKWIYGDSALRRGVIYPDALFKHFKRHIGENKQLIFHTEPQVRQDATSKRKYIIDTNIFIEAPLILDGMEEDVEVLIPKTVYEELGRRKNVPETAAEAEAALKSIEEHDAIVKFEDSHPELLTDDMFQSNDKNNNDRNDSKILSVAYFHDDKKTILLSNDKMVAEKADWQKHSFQVQNYKEFSFYRHLNEESDSPDELKLTGKDGATVFMKYLRDEIRKKIGYINKAVITVPQEFSPIQRNEIKDAGLKAGFTEIELQSEPIAAAVAYGLELTEHEKILVYDFGGGTFDVTILEISDGNFNRTASGGDAKLGGEDFTQALIDDFKYKLVSGEILPDDEEFDMLEEENSGLNHEEFAKNELRIWEACEDMKCRLSSSDKEEKNIKLYVKPGEAVDVKYSLSRDEFENITSELMVKAKKALDGTLQKAGLERADIDVVIMAGGTSTIPFIVKTLKEYFGKEPYADRDPATLIAEGAALFADIKWNQNSTIDKQIKIFDKTMTDLGVSLKGRRFDVIIPVNSTLPMQKKKIYSLVRDEQTELSIECFTRDEGSSASITMDDSIKYIGKVEIKNLPKLKRSEVDVEVTFGLTKEYELAVEVELKDKRGNELKQAKVTINTMGV
jgi:molecular chaperone DnaK (HSP70)